MFIVIKLGAKTPVRLMEHNADARKGKAGIAVSGLMANPANSNLLLVHG